MGEKLYPMFFVGTGTEKFSPREDGDGESFPDGEFSIAILSAHSFEYNTENRILKYIEKKRKIESRLICKEFHWKKKKQDSAEIYAARGQ